MSVKISQLPAASALTGAEIFPFVQSSVTKQGSLNLLASGSPKILLNITALRALAVTMSGYSNQVSLTYNWFVNDGGGLFYYDSTDTTTADNGGTVIVSANGARWKRQYADRTVNVSWFGAKGDGIQDDTTFIAAAIAAGQNVFIPRHMTCKTTAQLSFSGNDRSFICDGTLVPTGAIDCLVASSCNNCRFVINVNAPSHTVGYVLTIYNSSRCVASVNADDCFGVINLYGNNDIVLESVWAIARGPGVRWYGDNTFRSDVLTINKVLIDVGPGYYGFDWDGNCHTLNVEYLGLVCGTGLGSQTSYGVIIRNTSGGINIPAIGRFEQIEVDYALGDGIDMIAGLDMDFTNTYVNGCVGDGIQIGSVINDYEVRITAGKFIGNGGYGIRVNGGVVLYSANTNLAANSLGQSTGNLWSMSPRFALDAQAYFTLSGDAPTLGMDTDDYMAYDRSDNKFVQAIGGVVKTEVNTAFSRDYVPHAVPIYTVATLPTGQIVGSRAMVSNALAPSFGLIASAGGTTTAPVYFDGTNWRFG